MKECQGPALWVYNNATFSDADFEAIIKLSGATKSNQTEKIGGFGLGFNSVYNLTDVPSFLSRNYVVIFDPHTTHLGWFTRACLLYHYTYMLYCCTYTHYTLIHIHYAIKLHLLINWVLIRE